jgi:ABC-type branched-subunit amino acid transport system ATPase component
VLEVKNVRKNYGGIKAVDDVSVKVERQSITGLIGPNGAGKTTLFNVVSGAQTLSGGKVEFNGTDISYRKPWDIAKLGIIRTFQTPVGFPRMTVMENMLVFAANRQPGFWSGLVRHRMLENLDRDARLKAEDILISIGLEQKLNILVEELSAGELKLLEFARPLMADPTLLLLDEPAAGVNPAWLDHVIGFIERLRDQGMTFLIVDHNLGFIMRITDYLYVMSDGKLICQGDPAQVSCDEVVIESYIGKSGRSEQQAAKGTQDG